jgi:hypothetical protein
VPAQVRRTPRGVPLTATHWPTCPVSAQASHCPEHALSQQTPSVQWPLRQSSLRVQDCPCLILHAPAAVQVRVPAQLSGSSAPATPTQVPFAPVHAWQVPQAAVPQQRPSTQWPDVHSPS